MIVFQGVHNFQTQENIFKAKISSFSTKWKNLNSGFSAMIFPHNSETWLVRDFFGPKLEGPGIGSSFLSRDFLLNFPTFFFDFKNKTQYSERSDTIFFMYMQLN